MTTHLAAIHLHAGHPDRWPDVTDKPTIRIAIDPTTITPTSGLGDVDIATNLGALMNNRDVVTAVAYALHEIGHRLLANAIAVVDISDLDHPERAVNTP
jgi:hypothetical protein